METDSAFKLEVINATGKDIISFAVKNSSNPDFGATLIIKPTKIVSNDTGGCAAAGSQVEDTCVDDLILRQQLAGLPTNTSLYKHKGTAQRQHKGTAD